MSEWKCGKCGKEYSFDEFMKLPKIRAMPEAEDPDKKYGVTTVCYNCGYVFHKDKFRIRETLTISFSGEELELDVSTVFLGLNHHGYYYETMIFPKGALNCYYQERYKTEKEAIEGHEKVLNKIRTKKYSIDVKEFRLDIEGE